MNQGFQIPFSILDLAPITRGSTAAESFRNTLDLARRAEQWGYHRYWLAEHHNMIGIASAATAVVISYVANGTSTIRVGSGGVMLPNHAPLVIAEQFGTLESLYPGRIDLGIGRAPGTDQRTAQALRRERINSADFFPQDLLELQAYFRPVQPGQAVRAVPGMGLNVPIWLLGSSLFSAQLAAALGLPYAFASHFAPGYLMEALDIYRREFKPSEVLERPYAMAAINIIAAETDGEAVRLFTSIQQQFLNLRRGEPGQMSPPADIMDGNWTAMERLWVDQSLRESVVGSMETVQRGILAFLQRTKVDELMVSGPIYEHAMRLRSFEIIAAVRDNLSNNLSG
jgi:luciferase family oxidoreductase group 1